VRNRILGRNPFLENLSFRRFSPESDKSQIAGPARSWPHAGPTQMAAAHVPTPTLNLAVALGLFNHRQEMETVKVFASVSHAVSLSAARVITEPISHVHSYFTNFVARLDPSPSNTFRKVILQPPLKRYP
jgi:hypothetical protein